VKSFYEIVFVYHIKNTFTHINNTFTMCNIIPDILLLLSLAISHEFICTLLFFIQYDATMSVQDICAT